MLFGDCFTAYNEPAIGQSAVFVLEQLGYEVVLQDVGCCGRSMISVGMLGDAITSADRALSMLTPWLDDPNVVGIVVCEPSCLSAMKDDWLQLKLKTPIAQRRQLAERAVLVEDFVDRYWDQHPTRPANLRAVAGDIMLHGHCHQKALWGDQTSSNMLRRIGRVQVLPSGCCGMAGVWLCGRQIRSVDEDGELSVFPPVRTAAEQTTIVAPGTSCRHQIRDGTGRHALHPIQVVARWFGEGR